MESLETTNWLLTILTVLGIGEAVVFIGALGALLLLVRRLATMLEQMETRYVAPASERVNAILSDVHDVTTSARNDVHLLRRSVRRLARWVVRLLAARMTARPGRGGARPS